MMNDTITVRLTHLDSGSVVTLLDGGRHLGSISYTQSTHKYRAGSDYRNLITQNSTYGRKAALELFKHFGATYRR